MSFIITEPNIIGVFGMAKILLKISAENQEDSMLSTDFNHSQNFQRSRVLVMKVNGAWTVRL